MFQLIVSPFTDRIRHDSTSAVRMEPVDRLSSTILQILTQAHALNTLDAHSLLLTNAQLDNVSRVKVSVLPLVIHSAKANTCVKT
jgi:hypothetical protein